MNEQAKHTPGPWRYGHQNGKRPIWEQIVAGGHPTDDSDPETMHICTVSQRYPDRRRLQAECAANARLIAAAPELKHALENIIDATIRFPWPADVNKKSFINAARAALAKAEGRS